MFMRNITLCVIIFSIVSLFIGLPLAQSYPDPAANNFAYKTAERNRDNAFGEKDTWKDHYDEAMVFVNDLIGKWKDNEQAIKDDIWNTVDTATATLIAELVRRANQDSSDGTVKKLVDWLPIFYGTYLTAKSASSAADGTVKRADYLLALNTAVENLNEVLDENRKAFNAYEKAYDIYLKIEAEHSGRSANSAGLAREPNHSPQGDYSSVTATSFEDIKATVKAKDAYSTIDSENMFMFWYHPGDLRSTSRPVSHTIDRFEHFDNVWKHPELPKDKRCGGDCGQQFQTPVEHLVVCPHALTESVLRDENGNVIVRNLPSDSALLQNQAAPAGCGDMYYLCRSSDRDRHKIRRCSKNNEDGNRCNVPYRKCNNQRFKHKYFNTRHSDKGGGLTIGPSFGLFNAAPGDSHTAELTALNAYTSVKWFVKRPSQTGIWTLIETDNGDGSSTTASLTYTFPSGVSGDYVITAVYTDANTTEEA